LSIDPLQGSGKLGFWFCVPFAAVHDAHWRVHPVPVPTAAHDVQLCE
jgi:hypothetical protein